MQDRKKQSSMYACIFNHTHTHTHRNCLVAQIVKNLPAVQEAWVQSLGQEEPLEKGMDTHSSTLAWRIPCMCVCAYLCVYIVYKAACHSYIFIS